jgi:hypothetical protein
MQRDDCEYARRIARHTPMPSIKSESPHDPNALAKEAANLEAPPGPDAMSDESKVFNIRDFITRYQKTYNGEDELPCP